MASLPAKKKQSSGTVDWQNTSAKTGVVTNAQVHGAMKALAKKKGQMSKKSAKRVAGRLKGMLKK